MQVHASAPDPALVKIYNCALINTMEVVWQGDELLACLHASKNEGDTNEVLHDKAAAGQADGQHPHHARHHFSNRLLPTLPPCLCSCLRARACTRARCVRSVSPRRVASPRFASFRPVSPRIAPPRLA